MSKCNFNKDAKPFLLRSHFGMGITCKYAAYFQNTSFFLYKHNDYKHIEAEISQKTKHIVNMF